MYFIRTKCNSLSNSSFSHSFWHLAKSLHPSFIYSNFPPLFIPECNMAIILPAKADLFSQIFAYNSTLDNSGSIPLSPLPTVSFMFPIKISSKYALSALSGLDTHKVHGSDRISPVVLKNVLLCWYSAYVKLSTVHPLNLKIVVFFMVLSYHLLFSTIYQWS